MCVSGGLIPLSLKYIYAFLPKVVTDITWCIGYSHAKLFVGLANKNERAKERRRESQGE